MPEKPTEKFDINAPWREALPKVDISWVAQQITKQMEGDPGFRNQIGRASEERYAHDLARRAAQSSPQITTAESRWAAKIASGAAIAKESGEVRVQGSNASQSA